MKNQVELVVSLINKENSSNSTAVLIQQLLEKERQSGLLVNIAKIAIIFFVGLFLIGFFFPFYEYPNDSRGYGLHSIRLSNGEYEYTNELLESTGKWEYVPGSQIKTENNSSIPDSMPGLAAIGSVTYLIGDKVGLFYLGPIVMISILITSERIATYCFGRYVGLLTLIFLAANEFVFLIGRGFLTSNFFVLSFLFGTFFLIRFLRERRSIDILLASIFFTIPTFFRLNGIMLVPTELLIVAGYFFLQTIKEVKFQKNTKEKRSFSKYLYRKFLRRKTVKIFGLILIPYIIFLAFFASFNVHYFDDPLTSIYNREGVPGKDQSVTELKNFFIIDANRVEHYFNHFMPYPINRVNSLVNDYDMTQEQVTDPFGSTILEFVNEISQKIGGLNLGILSFLILTISCLVAIRSKKGDLEISVFSVLIFAVILFYSTILLSWNRQGSGRDVLPLYPLFYMILSYLIIRILQMNFSNKIKYNFNSIKKTAKVILLAALIIFIPVSFFYADYSQIIKKNGLNFKDPFILADGFPISTIEEIPKNGIVLTHYHSHSVIAYGAMTFRATALGENVNESVYQEMLETMKETVTKGYQIYAFKEPVLESERDFQVELVTKTQFVLKEYSENFCELILDETSLGKNDEGCLKEWKESRHWLQ